MDILHPRDEADIVEIVKAALANGRTLEVIGKATRRELGRPVAADRTLSLAALSGITMFEPSELVLTAKAGTPLREIVTLLDEHNQELAFEPLDMHRLYGGEPLAGTIGGLVAVNASGPRRIKVGAARDHMLGFHAISGRGDIFKSGGRVMKNVTGYDLSKLITGSFGTLGVMSEVTLKVLPKAETEASVVITGLVDAKAISVMCEASGLPFEVSSLAHISNGMSGAAQKSSRTVLRLEGPGISVTSREQDLIAHFKHCGGEFEVLACNESRKLWLQLRDAMPVAASDAQIWRLSTAPANGAKLVEAIRTVGVPLLRYFYDWAGGLIWLAVEPAAHAHTAPIRQAVNSFGGHATLIRADDEVRKTVDVFHPQPRALAALSARVKDSFDPQYILNPGRLVPTPERTGNGQD